MSLALEFDNFKENYDEDDLVLHTKWILDGASSMEEVIELARSFVGYLEELERNGYNLLNVVDNGNAVFTLNEVDTDNEDSIF